MTVILSVLLVALLGYTGWVLAYVMRSQDLDARQKRAQAAIVVVIPFFGPLAVHLINRAQAGESSRSRSGVDPQSDQGVDPASFSHQSHDQ